MFAPHASRAHSVRRFSVSLVAGLAALALALPAFAADDVVNVYTVGSNPAGNALDPIGNPIGGIPSIVYSHNYDGTPGQVLLEILAEGIDGGPGAPGGGEHDLVYFNGTLLGELTSQGFYSSLFNLQPGPGDLPPITGTSLSVFDVTSLVALGNNTVQIDVDPGNWINEIEVSSLRVVPEPSSLALIGFGLVGFAIFARRRA